MATTRRDANVYFNSSRARLEHLPGIEAANSYINRVSRGYFKTLGIHLLAGRTFRESDTADSPKVVVVSESFARYYFG